jgi:hypothetical protein
MQALRSRQVNQHRVDDTADYLYKGETTSNHQYVAPMANVHNWIGAMENALVDCSANGGICEDHILVQEEGSERFVDNCGLVGSKVSQLPIVTTQTLVTTHKGDAIAFFHQMALLLGTR